jgi:HD-GYP domain-containing protein (c-di-GMP phosphodiesterase class II)
LLADNPDMGQLDGVNGTAQQTHDVLLAFLREHQPALHQHLRQVGRLAGWLGRRLGLDPEALRLIRFAGELHDIGKAAIPGTILNKPGPLTDDEWKLILRHTIAGERILSASPALIPTATIVRSCQERWDGTGYPDGLSGEQIPFGSRVVFVCDAFDAMTSNRPYYRARGAEDALEELERGAGTQFDPHIVDTFIAAWREVVVVDPEESAHGSLVGNLLSGS